MMKGQKLAALSVRDQKAAMLDALVKQELANRRASQTSKMTRLKALRLARDAVAPVDTVPKAKRAAG